MIWIGIYAVGVIGTFIGTKVADSHREPFWIHLLIAFLWPVAIWSMIVAKLAR